MRTVAASVSMEARPFFSEKGFRPLVIKGAVGDDAAQFWMALCNVDNRVAPVGVSKEKDTQWVNGIAVRAACGKIGKDRFRIF